MQQNNDITRILTQAESAQNIFILGAKPVSLRHYFHKLSDDVSKCDFILISDNLKAEKTIQFLDKICHKCIIIIYNFTFKDYTTKINNYLDNNLNRFMASKQLTINQNGGKEKTLFIYSIGNSTDDITINSLSNNNSKKLTFFLVLKNGGGTYDYRYVNATADNIRNQCTKDLEITCLTDNFAGITQVDKVIKFNNNWNKWWGKIEIFRNDITQNDECVFMDLDTVCYNNIDFLWSIENDNFYGLRDFNSLDVFQTGLMRWKQNDNMHKLYDNFVSNNLYPKYKLLGDHEYIGKFPIEKHYFQDIFPLKIVSYKKSLPHLSKNLIDPNIICFHGNPRPHTIKHKFITDKWKY